VVSKQSIGYGEFYDLQVPGVHSYLAEGIWHHNSGKTAAAAAYLTDHVNGPPCIPGPVPHWIGIIAPTLGDAVTACWEGPSGLRSHNPGARLVQAPGGTVIRWQNGSQAKLFGADEPKAADRLRAGGNLCTAWLEEFAAWRYMDACWDQLRFGLRSGRRPHWVATTTPRPRPLLKKLISGDIPKVAHTHATMYDNPYLDQGVKAALEDAYAGTEIGDQELYGRLLEEVQNALWRRTSLAHGRITPDQLPSTARITVGVDPSGGAGEQGIVVTAKSGLVLPGTFPEPEEMEGGQPRARAHGFVLDDRTCRLQPEGWGARAVQAAVDWEADDICVEVNYGGDQAVAVLRTACERMGVSIPLKQVRATRGKVIRAQPVSALSAQGRWHHVGVFEELEGQLCTWYPELGWSPDRLDAMVWGPWHMRLVQAVSSGQGSIASAAAGRKIG
jgi:phage terminase large subunit-like protein